MNPPTIVYSTNEMSNRMHQMITEKRFVFAIITHRRSTSYTYGYLERQLGGVYRISSPDNLSYSVFEFEDIEAVGNACIWLKP